MRKKAWFFTAILVLVFALFVLFHERRTRVLAGEKLEYYSQLVKIHLWQMDTRAMREYLNLISEAEGYRSIRIAHADRSPFLFVEKGDPGGMIERLLFGTGIFSPAFLESPIRYENRVIGYVSVHWLPQNVYLYLYTAMVGLLAGLIWHYRSRILISRRRAEENARGHRYLKTILDAVPSVLVGVDNQGFITHWNLEAEKNTGFREARVIGQRVTDVFPELPVQLARIREAVDGAQPVVEHKIPIRMGDDTRFFDISINPLAADTFGGVVICIDDLTDRVRIEEVMIQTEKMISVGGLAAGMAHEINNPLAGILQNMQVLKNRISDSFNKNLTVASEVGVPFDRMKAYLQQRGVPKMIDSVIHSGRRAARIVESMLAFSRKSDAQLAPHPLSKLFEETLELAQNDYDLKKKYDFRKITIHREMDPNLPAVPCEKTKIQQVLLNILKNGAQAMASPDDDPPAFTIRIYRDGDMACIDIEDNGSGMDEMTRKRVFEPFFTTKGVGEGTGLGLSISYFIITENHGGRMEIRSTPGEGTVFTISLPFAGRTGEDDSAAAEREA